MASPVGRKIRKFSKLDWNSKSNQAIRIKRWALYSVLVLSTVCFVSRSVIANDRPQMILQTGQNAQAWASAFSPDSTILATADGHVVRLWSVEHHWQLATFAGHRADVHSLAFSPDGKILASGDAEGVIRLWDVDSGESLHEFHASSAEIEGLAFVSDGQEVLSAGWDGKVRRWNFDECANSCEFAEMSRGGIHSLAVSPDSDLIAAGDVDGIVRVWHLRDRSEVPVPTFPKINEYLDPSGLTTPPWIQGLSFGRGGRLAVAGFQGSIRILNILDGKSEHTLETGARLDGIAFSPDQKSYGQKTQTD